MFCFLVKTTVRKNRTTNKPKSHLPRIPETQKHVFCFWALEFSFFGFGWCFVLWFFDLLFFVFWFWILGSCNRQCSTEPTNTFVMACATTTALIAAACEGLEAAVHNSTENKSYERFLAWKSLFGTIHILRLSHKGLMLGFLARDPASTIMQSMHPQSYNVRVLQ